MRFHLSLAGEPAEVAKARVTAPVAYAAVPPKTMARRAAILDAAATAASAIAPVISIVRMLIWHRLSTGRVWCIMHHVKRKVVQNATFLREGVLTTLQVETANLCTTDPTAADFRLQYPRGAGRVGGVRRVA